MADNGKDGLDEQGQETWNGLVAQYETEAGRHLPDDVRAGAPRPAEPGLPPVTEVPGGFRMPLDLVPDEPDGTRGEADFEAG